MSGVAHKIDLGDGLCFNIRTKLFTGTVTANQNYVTGTVPVNKNYVTATVTSID